MCKTCIYPGASCANCPEQEEPKPTDFVCEYCGENFYIYDKYWNIDGTIICHNCVDSLTALDLLEWLGYKIKEVNGYE